jgi:hypothetical protein
VQFNKLWINLEQKLPMGRKSEKGNDDKEEGNNNDQTLEDLFGPVFYFNSQKSSFFVPTLPKELNSMIETPTVRDGITFEELIGKLLANVRENKDEEAEERATQ